MNGCIHLRTTVQPYFYSTILKKAGGSNDFWVWLCLLIIFTSVPRHGDKSTPLNRGCILQFYLEPGIQRTAQKL
jgi:hypothetical protein